MSTGSRRVASRNSMSIAIRLALWGGALALVSAASVQAQEAAPAPAQAPAAEKTTTLETVSVLGSRTKPRTEATSAVPIDILGGEEFHNQPAIDVLDKM